MPLLTSAGQPQHTKIIVQTRLQTDIDNIQPWHYSHFEWKQFESVKAKYEQMGAERVSEACPVYNCHGFTFASRRTQVDETGGITILKILEDDGYSEVSERYATVGDIVIYYDDQGLIQHSGLVVGRISGLALDVPKI